MKLKNISKIILSIVSLWLISVTIAPTYSSNDVDLLDYSNEVEYDLSADLEDDSDIYVEEIDSEERYENTDENPEYEDIEIEVDNEETTEDSGHEDVETEAGQVEEDLVALVHIEIDSRANVIIDLHGESYRIVYDGHYIRITLALQLEAEDIKLTMPEDFTYQVSQVSWEDSRRLFFEDLIYETGAEIFTHITVRHSLLDDIEEDGYVGIMPTVSGAPAGFQVVTVPANGDAMDWMNAFSGTNNRVISVQGNQPAFPSTWTISGGRQIIIASTGTNLATHSRSGTPFSLTRNNGQGRHFIVNSGASLTLSQITLNVSNLPAGTNRGGVAVGSTGNGTLTMQNGSTISGGRAHVGGGVLVQNSSSFTMNGNSVIQNNDATSGGGVFLQHNSTLTMRNSARVVDNVVSNHGGGIHLEGDISGASNATLNLYDTIQIARNRAPNSHGGGVSNGSRNSINMRGGTIEGNTALTNGGGVNGAITIHNGTIHNNTAGTNGGGINGTVTMHSGIISNNTASNNGGGISGTVTIHGGTSTIRGNTAGNNGGGIFTGNWVQATGGTIENNRAGTNGGGVFLGSMTEDSRFTNTRFIGNTAVNDGGAIFTVNYDYSNTMTSGSYGNLTVEDAYFNNNSASRNFEPPLGLMHVNISATNTSVYQHPLNNYDINYQRTPVPFSFTKMDELLYTDFDEARVLPNAVFRLYIRDENPVVDEWHYIDTVTSGSDGLIDFGSIIHGREYQLIEEDAPDGFMTPSGHWIISFDPDTGEMSITGNDSDMPVFVSRGDNWYVGNFPEPPESVPFEFIKTMDDGITPLPSAVFNLHIRDERGVCETTPLITGVISNENGIVVLEGLTRGHEYCLVETAAPNGFVTPEGYWVITVGADGAIGIPEAQRNAPNFIYRDGNFYLPNERVAVPITGLDGNMDIYIASMLVTTLMGLLVIYYNIWKKRQELIHYLSKN